MVLYAFCWLIIGWISSIDTFWAVKTRDTLAETELWPPSRFLIYLDNGDVSLFMGLKVAGTVTCLGVLILLYIYNRGWAWGAILPLFLFQIGLLVFLYTGFNF